MAARFDRGRVPALGYAPLARLHQLLVTRAVITSGGWGADFPGELIGGAKPNGLKVILYMTDDPPWHDAGGHAGSTRRRTPRTKGAPSTSPPGTVSASSAALPRLTEAAYKPPTGGAGAYPRGVSTVG
jgi:hypothetical protein